jgi:hypothetical protein
VEEKVGSYRETGAGDGEEEESMHMTRTHTTKTHTYTHKHHESRKEDRIPVVTVMTLKLFLQTRLMEGK